MTGDGVARKGPVDAAGRVLRELIRTPRFKDSVKAVLAEMDPENAAALVRILFWEDPEFSLGLAGSVPEMANTGIEAARETGAQLARLPPGLLSGFLAEITRRVNARSLGETLGYAAAVAAGVARVKDQALKEAVESFKRGFQEGISGAGADAGIAPGETRKLIEGLGGSLKRFFSENPALAAEVLAPLVEAGRDAVTASRGGETGESSPDDSPAGGDAGERLPGTGEELGEPGEQDKSGEG